MKYYYLNRIAMAVLVALLLFFGTRTLIDIVYQEHPPEKPGYEVAGTKDSDGEKKKEPADEGAAFIAALNKADPAKGEQDVGLCKVCHSFEKGGPTMIGPNLYGIVGMKIASHEGVNYSPALKGHGGDWTFENMDKWLTNPQAFAAGTTMAFPGIPDLAKRANIVAYLNKNSDDPLPIPEPKAAPEAADEGAAEDAAPAKPEVFALLATADAAKGEQAAALCKVCHTFEKGGAAMVGPNLHNVVGADVAHVEGFNYSAALKGHGGKWTYEALDAWLKNPQEFAAGTTMAFPGVPDAKKRADIIAFLMSHTDNPPPVPSGEAEPAAPAEEAKPAEDEAKPAEEPAAEEEPPLAAEPEEPSVTDEPAADEVMEKGREEIIINAPTVSDDAPSEPHKGEAPSPNQPQPVVPEDSGDDAAASDGDAAMEEASEVMSAPPTVSPDAPSEPHMGEAPSPNQPQPVVPDDSASSHSMAPASDDGMSSQPQPVYPDGEPGSASMAPAGGDGPSNQPQPVYPDGAPDGL